MGFLRRTKGLIGEPGADLMRHGERRRAGILAVEETGEYRGVGATRCAASSSR